MSLQFKSPHWHESRLVKQMPAQHQMATFKLDSAYAKDPKINYSYGTAGFRMKADIMKPVAYRVGILAALLSLHEGGKWIGVMITASHNPIGDNGVKLVDPHGEMIVGEWEELASELANMPEPQLIERVGQLMISSASKEAEVKVAMARDTRPSGPELAEAVKAGILSVLSGAQIRDFGLQTTPELHFNTWALNASNTTGYIEHFSRAFEQLLNGKMLNGQLIIDAANGVGAANVKKFCNRLAASTNFDPILINSTEGILNEGCGADFVKIQMREPSGITDVWRNSAECRFASLDGDADRLVYFYFSEGQFRLLDGDRIAVLFAFYLRKLLTAGGLENDLKLGVVQTAYANGASTAFLRAQGVDCVFACTGVKNLHHEAAANYDIGVYFEANGHGTILFSQKARDMIHSNPEKYSKLAQVMSLINQCVGDALSDALLVEAILAEEEMSMAAWDALYTEFPSRQLKVSVPDRSIYKCIDADTKVAEPVGLQAKIDELVAKAGPNARAFVRPSGTEDIVRVYAEASTREICDELANSVAELLKSF